MTLKFQHQMRKFQHGPEGTPAESRQICGPNGLNRRNSRNFGQFRPISALFAELSPFVAQWRAIRAVSRRMAQFPQRERQIMKIIDRGAYFSLELPDGRAADVVIMLAGFARLHIADSPDNFMFYDETW